MVNVSGIKDKVSTISMASVLVDDESLQAVLDVLKSGQLAQGLKVEEFEKAFADYIGTNYAIAVNSGTAALMLGCLRLVLSEAMRLLPLHSVS